MPSSPSGGRCNRRRAEALPLHWGSFAPPDPLQSLASSLHWWFSVPGVPLRSSGCSSRILALPASWEGGTGSFAVPLLRNWAPLVGRRLWRLFSFGRRQFSGLAPRGGPESFLLPLSHWEGALLPPRPSLQSFRPSKLGLLSTGCGRRLYVRTVHSSLRSPVSPLKGRPGELTPLYRPLLPPFGGSGSVGSHGDAACLASRRYIWLACFAGGHLCSSSASCAASLWCRPRILSYNIINVMQCDAKAALLPWLLEGYSLQQACLCLNLITNLKPNIRQASLQSGSAILYYYIKCNVMYGDAAASCCYSAGYRAYAAFST